MENPFHYTMQYSQLTHLKASFITSEDNLHLILISDRSSSKTAIIDLSCFLPSNEIMWLSVSNITIHSEHQWDNLFLLFFSIHNRYIYASKPSELGHVTLPLASHVSHSEDDTPG